MQHCAVVFRRGLLIAMTAVVAVVLLPGSANAAPVVRAGKLTVFRHFTPLPAPGGDPRIRGYDFDGQVSGDECGPSIGSGSSQLSAPSGDVVCGFSLAMDFQDIDPLATVGPVTGAVLDGSMRTPLTPAELHDGSRTEFAISVPTATNAVLELSSAGYSQSYSLTEKRRVGPSPTVLYESPSSDFITFPTHKTPPLVLHEEGLANHKSAMLKDTISSLELCWFLPTNPYRRPPSLGDAFLYITLSDTAYNSTSPLPNGVPVADFTDFVPAKDVQLRLSSGELVTGRVNSYLLSGSTDDYFIVPANFRRANLLVDPNLQPGYENNNSTDVGGPPEIVEVGRASTSVGGDVATFSTKGAGSTNSSRTAAGGTPLAGSRGGFRLPLPLAIPLGGGLGFVVVLLIVVPIRRRKSAERGKAVVLLFPPPLLLRRDEHAPQAPDSEQENARAAAAGSVLELPAGKDLGDAKPPRLVVKVLGPIEVDGFSFQPTRPVARELACYLAINAGRDVTSDELRFALGDGEKDLAPSTLWTYVSALRKALGSDVLVSKGKSTYRYVGELECDWSRFCELSRLAKAAQSGDERFGLLTSALVLVRGKPFEAVPPSRYRWAFDDRRVASEMSDAVEHTAYELAAAMLRDGKPEDAAEAARRGLLAQPYSRLLWAVSLRSRAGDRARLEQIYREATKALGHDAELARLMSELAGTHR